MFVFVLTQYLNLFLNQGCTFHISVISIHNGCTIFRGHTALFLVLNRCSFMLILPSMTSLFTEIEVSLDI